MENENYMPYGEEWKKEMAKLPKAFLIDMAAKIGQEKDAINTAQYGEKINEFDLFDLDIRSNANIKKYRESLGLLTPNNRIDTGDLKCIILSLHEMGFDVVKRKE